MGNEHALRRTIGQQMCGLLFAKVVAPRTKRGDRNGAAQSEERDSVNLHAVSVKHAGRRPLPTGFREFLDRFAVPWHEDRRPINFLQPINLQGHDALWKNRLRRSPRRPG